MSDEFTCRLALTSWYRLEGLSREDAIDAAEMFFIRHQGRQLGPEFYEELWREITGPNKADLGEAICGETLRSIVGYDPIEGVVDLPAELRCTRTAGHDGWHCAEFGDVPRAAKVQW